MSSKSSSFQETLLKVGVVGANSSGKSSLMWRFVEGEFSAKSPTGPLQKRIQVTKEAEPSEHVKIELVRYKPSDLERRDEISNLHALILTYSITSIKSFSYIQTIKPQLDLMRNKKFIVLVGTHGDKETDREVGTATGEALARPWGIYFKEISSKTGHNVSELFDELAKQCLQLGLGTKSSVKKTTPHNNNILKVVSRKNDSIAKMLPYFAADEKSKLLENWDKPYHHSYEWSDLDQLPTDSLDKILIDPKCRTKGYVIEVGRSTAPKQPKLEIEDYEKDIAYYREEFIGKEHFNYIGELESIGPVVISFLAHSHGHRTRAIVRTKYGHDRMYIPAQLSSPKEMLRHIKHSHPRLQNEKIKMSQVTDSSLPNELASLELKELNSKFKIGVLYVKENQVEEDMFSNVDSSPDFQEFLKIIGTKIELKSHTGFTGGLDVKHDSTGTHSVYTKFRDYEIMFHVSTMLPFQAEDKQRVERKRHLGNDICVLVFLEGDQPFNPQFITSQFNHVFGVVQKEGEHYRIAFASKPGVRAFGPPLPLPALKSSKDLRDFLLTKLVNGERGAMVSPEFKGKLITTRKLLLEGIIKKFRNIDVKSHPVNHLNQAFSSSSPVIIAHENSQKPSSIDNLVDIGRQLASKVVDISTFDIPSFETLLERLLLWTISSEAIAFGEPEQQAVIINSAKDVVKLGKMLSKMIEKRNITGSQSMNEEINSTQNLLRQILSTFFIHIKEVRDPRSENAPKAFFRSVSDSDQVPGVKGHGVSKERQSIPIEFTSKRASTQINPILNKRIDSSFQQMFAAVDTNFDVPHFTECLTDLASSVKDFAATLNEEESITLVESLKNLLQKGLHLKKETQTEEALDATKKQIREELFALLNLVMKLKS